MKFRKKIKDNLFNKKGYSHITSIIGFLILMMCLACFMSVTPVFITKFSLDNYANELIREAEISGIIGTERVISNSVMESKRNRCVEFK